MMQRTRIVIMTMILIVATASFCYAAETPTDKNGYTLETAMEKLEQEKLKSKPDAAIGYCDESKEYFIYYAEYADSLRYEDATKRLYTKNRWGYCNFTGGTTTDENVRITDLDKIYKIAGKIDLVVDGKVEKSYTQENIDNKQQTGPEPENAGILSGLTDIINAIKNIPSQVQNFITTATNTITEKITSLIEDIKAIPEKIITGFKEALQWAFVPTDEQLAEVIPNPDEYNFVKPQINDFQNQMGATSDAPPKLIIKVPGDIKWLPSELVILDCTPLEPQRERIHKIISAFLWLSFIQGVISNLPAIISGSGLISTDTQETK